MIVEILTKYFSEAKVAGGGKEVACLCPKCAPHKNNRRLTLYFSIDAPLFICFRCGFSGTVYRDFERIFGFKPVELISYYKNSGDIDFTDVEQTKVKKNFYYRLLFHKAQPFSDDHTEYPVIKHITENRRVKPELLKYMSSKGFFKVVDKKRVAFGDSIGNVQFYQPFEKVRYLSYMVGKLPVYFYEAARKEKIYLFEGMFDMLPHATEGLGVGMCVLCGKNRIPDSYVVQKLKVKELVFCFDSDVSVEEISKVWELYSGVCKVGFLFPPAGYKDWGEYPHSMKDYQPFYPKDALDLLRYYLTEKEECKIL